MVQMQKIYIVLFIAFLGKAENIPDGKWPVDQLQSSKPFTYVLNLKLPDGFFETPIVPSYDLQYILRGTS